MLVFDLYKRVECLGELFVFVIIFRYSFVVFFLIKKNYFCVFKEGISVEGRGAKGSVGVTGFF